MKKVFISFAAIAALISCVKETPVTDETPATNESIVTIEAVASKSKTQLVDGTNVQWTPGDKIKMCFDVKTWVSNNVWTGVEFENNGESVSESAFFIGSVDVNKAQEYGFVVYPTSFKFDSRTSGGYGENCTTNISHVLPSAQPAVENTFASDLNLSYAPVTTKQVEANISNKTPIKVTFINMCALIKVNLPAEKYNVKEILVESASTGLTGEYSMLWEATSQKQTLKLSSFKSEVKEVVLANEDGSNLTPGASYYAVVWPGQHNGLTFTFTDENGLVCVKNLNKTVNCEVGKITEINVKSLEFKEAEPELTVSTTSMEFGAASETKSLTFNTNKNWTITTDGSLWFEVSPKSGEASKDAISVDVKCYENTQYQSRTGNITISAGGLTKTIKVTQAAAKKVIKLTLSTKEIQMNAKAGSTTFTLDCNDDWIIAENYDWLTISETSGSSTSSPKTITVKVNAYNYYSSSSRSASVEIKAVNDNSVVTYLSVKQSPLTATSCAIGTKVTNINQLKDGQVYIIKFNKEDKYWFYQSSFDAKAFNQNLSVIYAFVYHKDSSSSSRGTWESVFREKSYINSSLKFTGTASSAQYFTFSNNSSGEIQMMLDGNQYLWYSGNAFVKGTTFESGTNKWYIYEANINL